MADPNIPPAEEGEKKGPSKAQLKKAAKMKAIAEKKAAKAAETERKTAEAESARAAAREAAKSITLGERPAGASAAMVGRVQPGEETVLLKGWVSKVRRTKLTTFVELRDGTGWMQCLLTGA